jgi:hypothetical protein
MLSMSNLSEKTTIYLNPETKRFIKHKAVADNRSVSELINEYLMDMAEDLHDIEDIKERRKDSVVSFDSTLKELGLTYDDLQS